MYGMPKKNSSFRLEESVKEAAVEVLARHGMTITEGVTAFLEDTAYQGKPAVTASKEARMHAEQLKFNALMKHKYRSEAAFENKEE